MRRMMTLVVLSLASFFQATAQDSRRDMLAIYMGSESERSRCLRIGVIPYQFFARSSGVYFSYDLKQVEIEYRGFYTYATNVTSMFSPGTYDNFYYRGTNNALLISHSGHASKWAIMAVFRYWWYNNKWLPVEGISSWSSYSWSQRKSGNLLGIGLGIEYCKELSENAFHAAFFVNASVTYCETTHIIYEESGGAPPHYRSPRTELGNKTHLSIALGFKLGYQKRLP